MSSYQKVPFERKKKKKKNFLPTICMRVRSSSIHGLLVIRRAVNNVFVEEEEKSPVTLPCNTHIERRGSSLSIRFRPIVPKGPPLKRPIV